MQGKVSVIVPVYNVEMHLVKCIESILGQTHANLELIIINDGSTDSSPAICDRLAQRDSRIRLIHQSNRGVSAARNAGLDHATGDYIAFIDSDDYVDEDYLAALLEMLTKTESDIAACGPVRETLDGEVLWTLPPMYRILENDDSICGLFRRDMYCGWPWNKLFKNNIIQEYGIRFDESLRICEDLLFNFQVFEHAKKVVYDSRTCRYHYLANKTSANLKMQTLGAFDYQYLNRLEADAKIEDVARKFSRKVQNYCRANSYISNENILLRMFKLNCIAPDLVRQLTANLRRCYPSLLSACGFGGILSKLRRAFFCLCPNTVYTFTSRLGR